MSPYLKRNKTGTRHSENIISGEKTTDQFRSLGKLPTYPSPKSTVCPKWELSDNVDLGEGWVVNLPES